MQSLWAYGVDRITWKLDTESRLIGAFLADIDLLFDKQDLMFNWEKKKGGYLLSPYPERIHPYSEVDFEVILAHRAKSELIYLEDKPCLYLNLRQKHGKYLNLHPSGFLSKYQKHPKYDLLLPPNWFLRNLVKQGIYFHSALVAQGIAFQQAQNALINAMQVLGTRVSISMADRYLKKRVPLPHGKLDYPIIGFRRFQIKERGDKVAIAPLNDGPAWKAKSYTEAVCTLGYDHVAPHERCLCGLHSFSTMYGAITYNSSGIVASIVAFGTVVQHDDEGFRAQKARIIGFLHPSVAIKERQVYGIGSLYSTYLDELAQELHHDVPLKLAEKYEVPLYYSVKAMEYAAKEFGDILPNDSTTREQNEPMF